MNIKYFSLIFSVLGILLLYFLSTLSQPTVIDLNEISQYESKQVIVQGFVREHHTTSYGSQIIIIEEENFTATVFIEGEKPVEYGDIIQATGEVQKYKDDWEIVVGNERFVKIIQAWENISFPVWQLAESPERYEGLNVNVTGFVDVIYDNYFYLIDSEGEHSIIVFYNPSTFPFLSSGQKISVTAQFRYDEKDFRYELMVSENVNDIIQLRED